MKNVSLKFCPQQPIWIFYVLIYEKHENILYLDVYGKGDIKGMMKR